MTTREMHIEIDLELQKLNSSVTKNIRPEEKDWFLNKEVHQYIETTIDKYSNRRGIGFQETLLRVEELRDLIKVKSVNVDKNDRGELTAQLPSNFLHFIRTDVYSTKECRKLIQEEYTVYESIVDLSFPKTILDVYKIVLVKQDNNEVTLFDVKDLPSDYIINTRFDRQHFLLKNALKIKLEKVLQKELSPNTSVYWDNSNTITVSSDSPFINLKILKNETTNAPYTTFNFETKSHKKRKYKEQNSLLKAKGRPVNEEFLSDIEISTLSKSVQKSPVLTVRGNSIILLPIKSVIIDKVDIVYICQPNIINLYLNNNLNMARHICEKIVTNTCKSLKAILNDGNYQVYKNENILTE